MIVRRNRNKYHSKTLTFNRTINLIAFYHFLYVKGSHNLCVIPVIKIVAVASSYHENITQNRIASDYCMRFCLFICLQS
jgi:hypothetical protein